ncbi:MAG: VWA domain-containing protein [Thermoanaerobaculales bacterium]|nr:VWA domain-containing protein [Thermoanaerobaculales bacterium]
MVNFAEPARLWFLLVPVVVGLSVLLRHRRRLDQQRRLASPAVWNRLMGGTPSTGLWRLLMWSAAAFWLVLALARPQWGELPSEVSVRTRDLVFALDVSDSMRCPDVRPNRLAAALQIVRRSLPGLAGNRIGVVVYSGEAYALVPLTTDVHAAATFLEGVEPGMVGRPGSNLEAAVTAALRLLPEEGDGRVAVFFTDGENLQGNPQAAAETLKAAGVSMLGVVVGTEQGGPIPEVDASGAMHYKRDKDGQPVVTHAEAETLRGMTEIVEGEVIIADSVGAEQQLVEAVERLRTREMETRRVPRRIERFPIFLGLSAVCLLLGFLLSPWRRRTVLVAAGVIVFGLTAPAMAQHAGPAPGAPAPAAVPGSVAPGAPAEPPPELKIPWWQRLIPGGSRRLARRGVSQWHSEDLEASVESFAGAAILAPEDPVRLFDLGTSLAAAGAGDMAGPILEAAERGGVAGAAYNVGTAALAGQQAEAAVQALRRALLADPSDPGTKRNYELALRLLEEQEEQEQEQEKDQDEKEDEDEEQQEQEEQQNGPQPTPTPSPDGQAQQPPPTPTPEPNGGLFEALDRAEADAREAMRTPAPETGTVEKDW